MIDNQRGRRNLKPGAWAELGLKRSALLEEQAKANQRARKGDQPGASSQTLDNLQPIDTLTEAAKYSGVSRATVAKAKKVYDSDNEELKQKVRTGETSINRAYQEIKKPVQFRTRCTAPRSGGATLKLRSENEGLYGVCFSSM